MKKKLIQKGLYGFPVINISPREYLNKGAEVILNSMEPISKVLTKFATAPLHGATSYTTIGQYRTKEKAKEQALKEKAFEEKVGPALSPSNHMIAWTQGSINPKTGLQKLAEWGPLALLGSFVADAAAFKYVPKGVKAATKNGKAYVISKTIDKVVRNNKPKADNRIRSVRIDDKIYDYSSNPLLEFVKTIRTSPTNSYFMRTPSKIGITKLRNGRFRHEVVGNNILPSGEVNGKFVSYGEPWKEFSFNEESALYEFPVGPKRGPYMMATDWKGRSKNYSVKEAYDYMKLEELLEKDLRQLNEQMGELFDKNYATIRNNLIESKYPLLKEHIDTSIYGGNQTVIPSLKWNFDNFLNSPFYKYTIDPISNQVQKELFIPGTLKSAKQQRVISKGTYPWYRGKQYSVKEVVNPDGTVNPRLAMRIQHEVSRQFPGSYKMEHRFENPEWHPTDPTTYHHTRNVAQSAWYIDPPLGFTKQDLMIAALGHDFGKIVAGDEHAQIGADLARLVFPDLTDALYTAIAQHMGNPTTPLGKVTKQADITNGRYSYSGYTPTKLNPIQSKFVKDVMLGHKWGMNRKTKPTGNKDFTEELKGKERLGYGAENDVYKDTSNPDQILKIPGDRNGLVTPHNTLKEAIREGLFIATPFNRLPYNLPLNIEGAIRTSEGKYIPVFSLRKVYIPQMDQPKIIDFDKSVNGMYSFEKPDINNILLENDILRAKDFKLPNIGLLPDGTVMGIDLWRKGGKLWNLKRN